MLEGNHISPFRSIDSSFDFLRFSLNSPYSQLYYHGEKIGINVGIRNYSNKEVKKIKASVQQCVDIAVFNTGQYRTTVASVETE